jgi:hypothetical protein
MRYSEHPHEYYLTNGVGPGSVFLGDVEMWNWLYLLRGLITTPIYDISLKENFNDSQRELMTLPPIEALEALADRFAENLPDRITPEIWARAEEAQARLFPPTVMRREDNVIHANFRRK